MASNRKKRLKKSPDDDIDKIYLCNLNFVPPKDQNLETIFEEPRLSKDGSKVLTSKIKYKRYLNFDPTVNKIQKRKRKAKKCVTKLKSTYRVTRSKQKISEGDVSLFIDILDESSNDSDKVTSTTNNFVKTPSDISVSETGEDASVSHSESCRSNKEAITFEGNDPVKNCIYDNLTENISKNDSQESSDNNPLKIPCALS